MIGVDTIRRSMRAASLGRTIYTFDSINSTNTFARTLRDEECPHGTVIVAEEQTAGKGRQGRLWQSQKGTNLLFSIVLKEPSIQEKIGVLPFAAALAAADGIERISGCAVECKWPNDLMLGRKKVAGMLIEAVTQSDPVTRVILGIGINVNQTEFAGELAQRATSLILHNSKEVDRVPLLCAIVEELDLRIEQLKQFSPQMMLDDWKRRTTMFGSLITLAEHSESSMVRAIDVAPNGALVIEDAAGVRREVFAGDVTIGDVLAQNGK